jgi:hypothetical protein
MNWIHVAQNRVKCWALLITVMDFEFSKFFTSRSQ